MAELKQVRRWIGWLTKFVVIGVSAFSMLFYDNNSNAAFDCSVAAGAFVTSSSLTLLVCALSCCREQYLKDPCAAMRVWANTNATGLAALALVQHATLVIVLILVAGGFACGVTGLLIALCKLCHFGPESMLTKGQVSVLLGAWLVLSSAAYGLLHFKTFDDLGFDYLGVPDGVGHTALFLILCGSGVSFAIVVLCCFSAAACCMNRTRSRHAPGKKRPADFEYPRVMVPQISNDKGPDMEQSYSV